MRFLKALWLIIFFFFSLIFFIQNKEALGQELTLTFDTYYFNYVWTNTAVPMYFIVLVGFLAGGIVTLGYLIMDRLRLRMELAGCRRDNRKKDKELKQLKAIPLEATPLLESGTSQATDDKSSS